MLKSPLVRWSDADAQIFLCSKQTDQTQGAYLGKDGLNPPECLGLEVVDAACGRPKKSLCVEFQQAAEAGL